LFKSQLKKPTD